MSSITLRMLEVENFGRFYDTTRLIFEEKSSAVVLGVAQGKSTLVDSLEFLSRAVLDGKIYNSFLNVSKMHINKPKKATRVEILIDIVDANHKGSYRYSLGVSDIGVISEFLMKESSGRRIFYRYKNQHCHIFLNQESIYLVPFPGLSTTILPVHCSSPLDKLSVEIC